MTIAMQITASLFVAAFIFAVLISGSKRFGKFGAPLVGLTGLAWLLALIWGL